MKVLIPSLAASAALLTISSTLHAQNEFLGGLENLPLGNSSLGLNPQGHLVVSNIGSSGLDGVRIELGESEGFRFEPEFELATGETCEVKAFATLPSSSTPEPAILFIDGPNATGETIVTPNYSALGPSTYTFRVLKDGQAVVEFPNQTGGVRLSNQAGGSSVPQKVYMLSGVAGLPFLSCVDWEGGVVPPGGGNPIDCDRVEFIMPTGTVTGVVGAEMTFDGPPLVEFENESARFSGHFVTGLEDAHIFPQGTLKVSNLGSSGCDGVSIDLGDGGSNSAESAFLPLFAPNNPGGCLLWESVDQGGHMDVMKAMGQGNQWLILPDFNQLGTNQYTLELHLQGQLVFAQSGMNGPAVSAATVEGASKRKVSFENGTQESEWSFFTANAQPYTVQAGPTILADKCIIRSQGNNVLDDKCIAMNVCGADLTESLELTYIFSTDPPCVGTNYCVTTINSTGNAAVMCSTGSSSIADNDLTLIATGTPANNFGIFFYGPNQVSVPFGNGTRCVGGGIYRLGIVLSDNAGTMTKDVDNTAPPLPAGQLLPGQIWNFQAWFRDTAAGGSGFNLSDGHWILFTP